MSHPGYLGEDVVLAGPDRVQALLPIVDEECVDDDAVISRADDSRESAGAFDIAVFADDPAEDIRRQIVAHADGAVHADAREIRRSALGIRPREHGAKRSREGSGSHTILRR